MIYDYYSIYVWYKLYINENLLWYLYIYICSEYMNYDMNDVH